MKGGKSIFISVFICCILLMIPTISAGYNISKNTNQIINYINPRESGFAILYVCGVLENFDMIFNETLNIYYYEGTVVNGFGIAWEPSHAIFPYPFIMNKGSIFKMYDFDELFPDSELSLHFVELSNGNLLFSMKLLISDTY